MKRLLAILFCGVALTAPGQPSYWFSGFQRQGNAELAQEYFFHAGSNVFITYTNPYAFINATGGGGTPGPQGPQGLPGVDGTNGIQGPQGIQGVPGVNGTNGGGGLLQTNIYATNLIGLASGTGIYFSTNAAGTLTVAVNTLANITQGLTAWWKFNEGTGTTAADSTGNGHAATLSGSPLPAWTATAFPYPWALAFNNDASYVDAGTSGDYNITTNDFSLCAWVYHPSSTYTTWEGILTSASSSYILRLKNGAPEFYCNYNGPGLDVQSLTVLPEKTWYWIVATRSGSTFSIYTNGVLDKSLVLGVVLDNQASPSIVIGNDENYVTRRFQGVLSEVRVYGKYALTASDVTYMYNTYYGGSPSSKPYVQKSGDTMSGSLIISGPTINYLDDTVVTNLGITSPVHPSIRFDQTGAGSYPVLGPGYLYYGDEAPYPGGPVYDGFHFTDAVILDAYGASGSLVCNFDASFWGNVTLRGPNLFSVNGLGGLTSMGVHWGDGSLLTNVPTLGLTITQSVVMFSGSLTNQIAYTNVFANGLLVASGPFAGAVHGSSLIQPGGGYLLQPGAPSTILLP